MRKYPLVVVEWDDTSSYGDWKPIEGLSDKVSPCISVGWKVKADRKSITIVCMRSSDDCNNRQVIPRGCIKSIKVIKNE